MSKVLGADAHRRVPQFGVHGCLTALLLLGGPAGIHGDSRSRRGSSSVFGFTCHVSTQSLSGQCARRAVSPPFQSGRSLPRPLVAHCLYALCASGAHSCGGNARPATSSHFRILYFRASRSFGFLVGNRYFQLFHVNYCSFALHDCRIYRMSDARCPISYVHID